MSRPEERSATVVIVVRTDTPSAGDDKSHHHNAESHNRPRDRSLHSCPPSGLAAMSSRAQRSETLASRGHSQTTDLRRRRKHGWLRSAVDDIGNIPNRELRMSQKKRVRRPTARAQDDAPV